MIDKIAFGTSSKQEKRKEQSNMAWLAGSGGSATASQAGQSTATNQLASQGVSQAGSQVAAQGVANTAAKPSMWSQMGSNFKEGMTEGAKTAGQNATGQLGTSTIMGQVGGGQYGNEAAAMTQSMANEPMKRPNFGGGQLGGGIDWSALLAILMR